MIKFIDLFCGAGGVTTGIENAFVNGDKCAEVVACVNHDPLAIQSHEANHPGAIHYTEDIRTLDVSKLPSKKQFKKDILCLWASLECTNFSKAKGGLPRDQDSRTLAEELYHYIDHINPDYIMIENVREFMAWGPLDENGKPRSMKNGKDYLKWVYAICDKGYHYDFRLLNAADFGAHTSRIRYFGMFAKKKGCHADLVEALPIIFPEATHSKKELHGLHKWKAVREVLNLDVEGESIFTREKPLAEKTLERIYAGLIKFVAGGKDAFLVKYNSMSAEGKYSAPDIDAPLATVPTRNMHYICQPEFITKYFSGKPDSKNSSVQEPLGTIRCKDGQALVKACFLVNYRKNNQPYSLEDSNPTISTHDSFALVTAKYFIAKEYTTGDNNQSIDAPAGVVVAHDKHKLVEAKWLLNTNFNNTGNSLDEPAPVITANRKHHYLLNPQWNNTNPGSIDNPAMTLIARMDKTPPYLVTSETGEAVIVVFENDSAFTVKIKEFMALYGIADIKMRMLQVTELKLITGFAEDYYLAGSKTHQKKFIGNAVPPIIPQRWIESMYRKIVLGEEKLIHEFKLIA